MLFQIAFQVVSTATVSGQHFGSFCNCCGGHGLYGGVLKAASC